MNLTKKIGLLKKKFLLLQDKKYKIACKNYARVFKIYYDLKERKQINKDSLKVNVVKLLSLIYAVYNALTQCYNEGIDEAYDLIEKLEDLQDEMHDEFSDIYDEINNFIDSIVNEETNEKQ